MSVTVQNLLAVDLFKDSVVVAGAKGLNNEIERISFIDCPFPEDIYVSGLIKKGDLFINSFYIVKEDDEKLFQFINAYIEFKCSGSIIITEYISKLPQKVLDLCNKHNFPVVFIDPAIPYAEIIKTTMEMILADKSDTISEMKIEKILDSGANKKTVIETASDVNRSFKKHYASLYIRIPDITNQRKQILISNIKTINFIETVKYKNGFFTILNFDRLSSLDMMLGHIKSILNKSYEEYHIGISSIFEEIEDFNICMRQSLLAFEISFILEQNAVCYKDVNLYKILYPLKDTDILTDFYSDIISPLTETEANGDKHELINTIESYLENDGDFKKTALMLNQHENTVRYRISKAKRILNLENNNFKFIEQVSIALKIKNMLKL